MTKFFVDAATGVYLGGFDGVTPPVGATEVQTPPADAGQLWGSGKWLPLVPSPADIKAEAERRILAIMPEHHQRNLMALALETMQQHGPNLASWPADLKAINADAMGKWGQIKVLRAKSDEIEALDPIPADYAADSYWG